MDTNVESEKPRAGGATDTRRIDRWVCLLLAACAVVVFSRHITVGGLRFGDACPHAMDGVLIHDWILAGPDAWLDPMGFATRQYAHHPTLGIGRVYPPGFAVVEAVFFAVLGVSAVTARICVVAFGVAGAVGGYLLTRRLASPIAGVCASCFLMAMPAVVWWTRQTMLEMPTLCMIIWTCWVACRYIERPGWGRLVLLVLFSLSVPLFKQTAVFVVPVLGLILLAEAKKRRVPWRQVLVAFFAVVAPLGLMFAFTLTHGGDSTHMARVVSLGRPLSDWLAWASLMYYPSQLPNQVGYVLLACAGLGLVVWMRGLTWLRALPLLYLLVFCVMSVLIQAKEPRYFFFGFLPIAMLAGAGADWLITRLVRPRLRPLLACVACVIAVAQGYRMRTWLEPDYTSLIAAHETDIAGGLVLFEGKRDGDFVFAARKELGSQRSVVLRGSKLLYTCPAWPKFGYQANVESTEDVRQLLERLGIETLFVERVNLVGTPAMDLLHAELRDPMRYTLVASHRLVADAPGCHLRARVVDVYKPVKPAVRTVRFVDIPIPIDSRTIRIDLDQLAG